MKGPEDILKNEEVLHTFEAGLDNFALGNFVAAQKLWEKVLKFDPDNELAIDYIRSMKEEMPFEDKKLANKEMLDEAIRMIGKDQIEPAYELLVMVQRDDPENKKVQKFLDTAKGLLLKDYVSEIGSTDSTVRLKKDMGEIMKMNLTKEAAFILSTVDGSLSVDEMHALSNIDRFVFMRSLVMLLRNNIVSIA